MSELSCRLGTCQNKGTVAGLASRLRNPQDVKDIMSRLADGLYERKGKPLTEREVKGLQHKYAILLSEQKLLPGVREELEKYILTF